MASRAVLVHRVCPHNPDLLPLDEKSLDLLVGVAADGIDPVNEDGSARLLHFDIPLAGVHEVPQLLVVDLEVGDPHRGGESLFAVLLLLSLEDVLEAHLQQSLLRVALDRVALPGAGLSVGEDCRVVALIDVVEDLLADVVEEEAVVDWRVSHGVVGAVVAAVEAELFDFSVLGIPESGLLSFHLNDIFGFLFFLSLS